jgi:glucose-6-phosphate-specific signal transduction histidine kinase
MRAVLLFTATTLEHHDNLTVEQALRSTVREMKLYWGYVPWCQQKILQRLADNEQTNSLQNIKHLTGVSVRALVPVLRQLALEETC